MPVRLDGNAYGAFEGRLPAVYVRACPLGRGGRSLAPMTAIHGIGMDPATITNAIHGLFQRASDPAARSSAGIRTLISTK